MAVACIVDIAGGTADDYDWMMDQMALGERLPAGALFHAAGAGETGWRACDVWESPEVFQRFAEAKIAPLAAQRGLPEPEVTSFEINEIRRRSPEPITFLQVVHLPVIGPEQFVELDKKIVGESREAPPGCIFHVNGRLGDDWVVMDAWTDKGIRDAFLAEHVGPVMQEAGLGGPRRMDEMAIHNSLTESAAPAGL